MNLASHEHVDTHVARSITAVGLAVAGTIGLGVEGAYLGIHVSIPTVHGSGLSLGWPTTLLPLMLAAVVVAALTTPLPRWLPDPMPLRWGRVGTFALAGVVSAPITWCMAAGALPVWIAGLPRYGIQLPSPVPMLVSFVLFVVAALVARSQNSGQVASGAGHGHRPLLIATVALVATGIGLLTPMVTVATKGVGWYGPESGTLILALPLGVIGPLLLCLFGALAAIAHEWANSASVVRNALRRLGVAVIAIGIMATVVSWINGQNVEEMPGLINFTTFKVTPTILAVGEGLALATLVAMMWMSSSPGAATQSHSPRWAKWGSLLALAASSVVATQAAPSQIFSLPLWLGGGAPVGPVHLLEIVISLVLVVLIVVDATALRNHRQSSSTWLTVASICSLVQGLAAAALYVTLATTFSAGIEGISPVSLATPWVLVLTMGLSVNALGTLLTTPSAAAPASASKATVLAGELQRSRAEHPQ